MMITVRRLAAFAPSLVLFVFPLAAQQDRLPSQINRSRSVTLPGRVPARARAGKDLGQVSSSFSMPDLVLLLKGSTVQQQALTQLIQQQQDPTSSKYHQWLTPEQYADQFGVSQNDVDTIVQWLQSGGFKGIQVSRSRTYISFKGTAQQVQSAFGTAIDQYSVNGKVHYANVSNPSIPADLTPVVAGIRGLHDFRWKPRYHKQATADMTSSNGSHHMAPDDFATIYNVTPLYNAQVDGTGQSLVVVGQTAINTADITAFRNTFQLPAIKLQQVLVPGRPNPGVVSGDLEESDLDIEWASAVARNANIIFVYSDDVWQSAMYAVDQAIAPVLTMSYGGCESYDLVDLPTFQQLAQQANAQGMT
ncbi:MAG TPA: protease pro-enzyme activation domain-containing protein, partial [Edaphobacter sp.]|nr:protease pro-enzyme activation domain-containing protein [Edaphobacter sp.]